MKIGVSPTSSTTVLHAGSQTPNAIAGDLTINGSSVLNLTTGQWNRASAGGTFTINNSGSIRIGLASSVAGFGSVVAGSNFPGGFSTISLAPGSTVEYNGPSTGIQTVFSTPVYGNLTLSNSGLGTATKQILTNLPGIAGNLSINSNTIFNIGSFTVNRSSSGGVFAMKGTARLNLTGTTGGAGLNNNFPANFGSYSFGATSTVAYLGGAQGIFGGAEYGHIELGGTGIKTAPSSLLLNGNFTKLSTTSFAHNNGLVTFKGGATQTFSSTSPIAEFYDLSNVNTVGLITANDLGVIRKLSLGNSAKLNLGGGNIYLRSRFGGTANVGILPASSQISYSGSGRFVVERFINYYQNWNLLSAPIRDAVKVRDSWQESGSTGSNGRGTQVTGPGGGNGLDQHSV
ncbi:MAG: hypothetical protein EOP49_40090, partial [Sphingobacteriales bacterium]